MPLTASRPVSAWERSHGRPIGRLAHVHGGFFLVVGCILLFESGGASAAAHDLNLDLWAGSAFIAFALFAMGAAVLAHRKSL